jgi:phenylpropionate dioxygenase-like ring-hydroxylating dioxygenase large terminal subunit
MFIAHVNDILPGIKKPLEQYKKTKTISNDDGEYRLYNNICPHQGSLILTENSKNFSCRYHGWSWNDQGAPTSSGSTVHVCNNFKLSSKDVAVQNSLIFSDDIKLPNLNMVDLSHMQLQEERIDRVKSNFKHIIDIFLDVDHIPVLHVELYDQIGVSGSADVEWRYSENASIQIVKKTAEYSEEYSKTLLGTEEENQLGSFWLTVYPYTMIEWQPGAMFVTVCVPGNDFTDVCVMKYRDSRYSDLNWKMNSDIWETAWEQDREQSESMARFLEKHPHLEESKVKFRKWLFKNSQ